MTLTVLVPDDHGVAALSTVDGVRALVLDTSDPARLAEAEVLVPPFLSVGKLVHIMERMPRLRLVQLLTAGVEAWIGHVPDGVQLSNCRGAHGGSTAEWVFAALLSFYRDLPAFDAAQRAGEWDFHVTDTMQDKRMLVVGAGDLGEQLRRRFDTFDAHTTLVATRARAGVHGVDELPDLLGEHDAVIMVVPMTDATRRMVDAEFLSRMRDGAILVNAARGPVVETDALVAELNSGRLRAALDVTDPEPLPPGHPLWTAPNLLLTPHVAGSVTGRGERAWAIAARQIEQFAAGKDPDNVIRGAY
ncbi:2-hydroxyacid dehydrogenase [Allokutzneria sp. A3M-2-11 16]|uniref:2-hydroxyacid dehydrogenase n=1 Tax=Allokutzneria sp. A3M-2-11 16 TaxID=2962043 RepID=UPI0035A9A960